MVFCLPATRAVYSRFALCTRNPELAKMTATSANVKKIGILVQLIVTLYATKPIFVKTSVWWFRSQESQK